MRKAQSATEYIIIIGFVSLLLTPLIYLVYDYSQDYSRSIALAQTNEIGHKIVDSAESIYYFGNPSRVVLELAVPEGLTNMSIFTNLGPTCTVCTELRFEYGDGTEINIPSKIQLIGPNPTRNSTLDPIIYYYNRTAFSVGLKKFQLVAHDDFVFVHILK